jgi:type III pantothenate kinase
MLLVIDVGNSSTRFGIFDNNKLKKNWTIETKNLFKWKPDKSIASLPAIISSVVPAASKILRRKLIRPRFVDARTIKGLKIKLKNKSEIGADRVVDAYAAINLYGIPAIILDFGTATTFDVISKKGEYLGGSIAPGIGLSRDVLHERTAKLPRIEIKAPKNIIGRSTVDAMRSGLVYGYASMVDGMIERLKDKTGKKTKVIATGGYAKLIAKYASGIDIIDIDLTLKGLNLIWQKN